MSEQELQEGRFIDSGLIDEYIGKITFNAEFITHYVKGQCAGFVAFYCNNPKKNESYISMLLTAPRFRGRKIASNLIDCVLGVTKERGYKQCALEVKKNNEGAISLYSNKGFAISDELSSTYIMKKNIT